MFERCGIRDVLFHAGRCRWFILIVTGAFLLAGTAVYAWRSRAADKPADTADGVWIASASYLVSLDPSVDIGKATMEQVNTKEESMAASLNLLLTADFSRERIFNKLLENYTPRQIVDALELKIDPNQLTSFALSKALTSSVVPKTSVVNMYLKGKNRELVQDYLAECRSVFEEGPSRIRGSRVEYIGGVVDQDLSDVSPVKPSKPIVIPLAGIVGLVLALLAVCAKALIWPTVNRKSDFCAYELPMLGEAPFDPKKEG